MSNEPDVKTLRIQNPVSVGREVGLISNLICLTQSLLVLKERPARELLPGSRLARGR